MIKNNYLKLPIIIPIILLLVSLASTFLLCFNPYSVDAEVTNDSILNFNQQFNFGLKTGTNNGMILTLDRVNINIKGTSTGYNNNFSLTSNSTIFVKNHKYYINFISKSKTLDLVMGNSANWQLLKGKSINTIFVPGMTEYRFGVELFKNQIVDDVLNINVIDLTQMYGIGNEPTLEEIGSKNIFPTYYNYQPGISIADGTLNNNSQAFIDGFNTAMTGHVATIPFSAIYSNLFIPDLVNINNSTANFSIDYEVLNPYLDSSGVIGFALPLEIPVGTKIDFSGEFLLGLVNDTYFKIGYVLNGYFYTIYSLKGPLQSRNFSGSFILPVSTNNLYFTTITDDNSFAAGGLRDFKLSYISYNNVTNFYSAYEDGRNSVLNNYKKGAPGFENIYNSGFNAGVASHNDYSFVGMLTAVLDVPVKTITGLLDFDFLGVNLKSLLFSLLTISIILIIVKVALGVMK